MRIPIDPAGESTATSGCAIQAERLSRRFGRKTVLHHLDLAVGGGICGLLGPNGAGKTTLLRMLATTLAPTSGAFHLLGLDPRQADQLRAIRRRSGYLPQTFGYYGAFTAQEFVEYVALLKDVPRSVAREAAREALHHLDLQAIAHQPLRTLSGGQVQRVGLAQAIVNTPDLLLLDEPTAGLDPEQRLQFRRLLRRHARTGAVLLSTHILEDISTICDTAVLIQGGVIHFQGTPVSLCLQGEQVSGMPDATPLERGYIAVMRRARTKPEIPAEQAV